MAKVNVNTEWGQLKEVIIGIPWAPDDKIFDWTDGMDEEFSWMKPDTFEFLKNNAGKTWKEANPDLYNKIEDQVGYYVDVLEKNGVTVYQSERLVHGDRDYINSGIEQVWPRDVYCTAGSTVIIASLRMPWKRKQQFGLQKFYVQKMLDNECKYISAPQASTEILSPRSHQVEGHTILLDGGDFMPNGNEAYLGIGHGSNYAGAKFAQDVLGDDYKVYPLELSSAALHLDCTIALPRPGLGIICRPWLVSDLPEALKDFNWIEATEQEACWLGVNGLPLNPETYLIDSAHERIIKELQAHGQEVIEIPYDGPSYLGGSLRCSSQPLVRVD